MGSGVVAGRSVPRAELGESVRAAGLVGLLAAALLVPHLSSNGFEYPAVSDGWVLLVFCALVLVPFLDLNALRRLVLLDLIALLAFVLGLALGRPGITWPVLLAYPPMLYLAARMFALTRASRTGGAPPAGAGSLRLLVRQRWLLVAIAVLAAVHIWWALAGSANVDVGWAGVDGAKRLLHGRALYGEGLTAGVDLHLDTYGPLDYLAYVPFAELAHGYLGARLASVFFDLLTALLLFALGRRERGAGPGVVLAYLWLAFPLGLYSDALGLNDSLVAALLVATLLAARSPRRRGATAALAAWVKLCPLALVPLLAQYRPDRAHPARRTMLAFLLGFALITALTFIPVLLHDSPATFISRTLGFQAGRAPEDSLWATLQNGSLSHAAWLATLARVLHGLVVAMAGAFLVHISIAPRRQDLIGLAAASAAILITLQIAMSYYSYSYTLWFAPLVLAALFLERPALSRAR